MKFLNVNQTHCQTFVRQSIEIRSIFLTVNFSKISDVVKAGHGCGKWQAKNKTAHYHECLHERRNKKKNHDKFLRDVKQNSPFSGSVLEQVLR